MSDTAEGGGVDAEGTEEQTEDEEIEDPAAHLDVEDGCGCAEVWEHMSEQRND